MSENIAQMPAVPTQLAELSNIKAAGQQEIVFNRDVQRISWEFRPENPREYWTNGDSVQFSIKGYQASFISLPKSYIKAKIAINEPVTNFDANATTTCVGFSAGSTQTIVAPKNHLMHLLRGTFSIFSGRKTMIGSQTIENNQNYDMLQYIQNYMTHKAPIWDEVCGFDDPDSIVPGNPWGIYQNSADAAKSYNNQVDVIIPLSTFFDEIPYLAEYNLYLPPHIELTIGSVERMFAPLITEWRLQSWRPTADTNVDLSYNYIENYTLGLYMSNPRLVVEGLTTTDTGQMDLVPQEWHTLVPQSGLAYTPQTNMADISIPVQHSSVKYAALVKVPKLAPTTLALTGSTVTMKNVFEDTSNFMDRCIEIAFATQDYRFRMDCWGDWYFTRFFWMLDGRVWPTDFVFSHPYEVYMELLKEFHSWQIAGPQDEPKLTYKARHISRQIGHMVQVSAAGADAGSATPAPFFSSYNLTSHLWDCFAGVPYAITNENATSIAADFGGAKQLLFGNFTKFVQSGREVIGAFDTTGRVLQVHLESNKNLHQIKALNGTDDVGVQIYWFIWYDAVVGLQAQIGNIMKWQ